MTLRQLIAILLARKWTVAMVTALTVVTAAVLSFALPPRYTATATVFVDLRALDRVGVPDTPLPFATSYMATQLDIIRSQRVAQEAVRSLGVERFAGLKERFAKETGGRGVFDAWVAEELLRELDVRPSRESSVIDVSFTARTARDAADVANAFANAYIDTQVRLRVDPAERNAAVFAERSSGLRAEIDRAQRELSTFQREKGLAVSDEKLDSEVARLDQLTKELALAQAQAAEARTRQRVASGADPSAVPEVIGNPLVQALKGELSKLEGKLRELDAKLGPAHPQYLAAAAEVESARRRLNAEIRNVVDGITSAARIATNREAQLRGVVNTQKANVLALRQARDQAGLMSRDMEGAQKALDASRDRLTTARLESQIKQSNVSILAQAVEPPKPAFPRPKLNIALALVLGSMLGAGVALGREISDQRVRSEEDLRTTADLPLLGAIPLALPGASRGPTWVLQQPPDADAAAPGPAVEPLRRLPAAKRSQAAGPDGAAAGAKPPAKRPKSSTALAKIARGMLSEEEIQSVMKHKREHRMSFIDAARSLKLLSDDEVHRLVALQYGFPYPAGERLQVSDELIAMHAPFSPEAEALRGLRTQLMTRWLATHPARRSLAIVGAERGAGRTFLAANLAVVFAQLGVSTLLVDADLRTPRVHALFGVRGSIGLSSLLAGEHDPAVICRFPELPNLAVLPAGMAPPNPQELVGRDAFAALLEELGQRFDIILFDTPATDTCADASLVAARAGGTMLVARKGETRLKRARALAADLAAVGSTRVGLVLNAI
jgi:chain length determinant protein tyrosine kinase EpsG